MKLIKHDTRCPRSGRWFLERECREFSTDGTRIGAEIAHLYGTTDEEEIKRLQEAERIAERDAVLTGMEEEQADWEDGLDQETFERIVQAIREEEVDYHPESFYADGDW